MTNKCSRKLQQHQATHNCTRARVPTTRYTCERGAADAVLIIYQPARQKMPKKDAAAVDDDAAAADVVSGQTEVKNQDHKSNLRTRRGKW